MQNRLGKVEYLNSKPVEYGIDNSLIQLPEVEIISDVPSKLNELIYTNQLEISNISAFEYAKHFNKYYILPDLSISAKTKIQSILLFGKTEGMKIQYLDGKCIALHQASATSVNLLKIILKFRYNINAKFIEGGNDLKESLESADAVLLIGDVALRSAVEHPELIISDLGQEWYDFTGIGMVFALWVCRTEFADYFPDKIRSIHNTLIKSKKLGIEHLEHIAELASQRLSLDKNYCLNYLNLIEYNLDTEHLKSLSRYFEYLWELGLITSKPIFKILDA